MQVICTVEGCENRAVCRGWCNAHYKRWRKNGSVADAGKRGRKKGSGASIMERFWRFVEIPEDETRCWLWTGSHLPSGYGILSSIPRPAGKVWTCGAHRVAYMLLVGPIPEGYEVDHVRDRGCVHRNCVNPAHLEAVTRDENLRRAVPYMVRGEASPQGAKTHCAQGHAYDEKNTYIYHGSRRCRRCTGDRVRALRARRAA